MTLRAEATAFLPSPPGLCSWIKTDAGVLDPSPTPTTASPSASSRASPLSLFDYPRLKDVTTPPDLDLPLCAEDGSGGSPTFSVRSSPEAVMLDVPPGLSEAKEEESSAAQGALRKDAAAFIPPPPGMGALDQIEEAALESPQDAVVTFPASPIQTSSSPLDASVDGRAATKESSAAQGALRKEAVAFIPPPPGMGALDQIEEAALESSQDAVATSPATPTPASFSPLDACVDGWAATKVSPWMSPAANPANPAWMSPWTSPFHSFSAPGGVRKGSLGIPEIELPESFTQFTLEEAVDMPYELAQPVVSHIAFYPDLKPEERMFHTGEERRKKAVADAERVAAAADGGSDGSLNSSEEKTTLRADAEEFVPPSLSMTPEVVGTPSEEKTTLRADAEEFVPPSLSMTPEVVGTPWMSPLLGVTLSSPWVCAKGLPDVWHDAGPPEFELTEALGEEGFLCETPEEEKEEDLPQFELTGTDEFHQSIANLLSMVKLSKEPTERTSEASTVEPRAEMALDSSASPKGSSFAGSGAAEAASDDGLESQGSCASPQSRSQAARTSWASTASARLSKSAAHIRSTAGASEPEPELAPLPARARPAVAHKTEQVTTGEVRNIPKHIKRDDFVDKLRAFGLLDDVDFLYLPVDIGKKCTTGKAIVNFKTAEAYGCFEQVFGNKRVSDLFSGARGSTLCEVSAAQSQGKQSNVAKIQHNGLLMDILAEKPQWLPLIFNQSGEPVDFLCEPHA
eukprot:CAMPEP_0194550358 /NCGR_PEP_ID=MMETSP0253-20130528/95671_1 /TAXON_ID=2966 /ORGANISM="Noctiluca scintillans" /LENGTH=741 /DNA_ID=CAMNT_0039397797 /DNA_START=90 /DNA_END=2315 /DNA_ORIENTATION=+